MVVFKPFSPYMPKHPENVAADPYDVVSVEEAQAILSKNRDSFLAVDKPEALQSDLPLDEWGKLAREELERLYEHELTDHPNGFYVYRLTSEQHQQTGLVATFSVMDYEAGRIKIHEHTRETKERERIEHVQTTKAHTGPILLSHPSHASLKQILHGATEGPPLFSFTDERGVKHEGFMIPNRELARVMMIGATIPSVYIADGHHRAKAAAVVAGINKDDAQKNERSHFLGVLFPSDELMILPYHRLLSHIAPEEVEHMLEGLSFSYEVKPEVSLVLPKEHGVFGAAYRGKFYRITKRKEDAALDVAILQRDILTPYFNVADIRTDARVDFIGGNRSITELEQLVKSPDRLLLTCHETTMSQLMRVADDGGQMPPKSTWFEPKLKSGLFIHRFD
ncbi:MULTISPECIES: DUF1015 family protein [unclassified Exiguobacterium]|uniref:DUF1015 domain-containing protein n=1 Tax=unclassified Exiguobacterium TaxID=2644629 RepID=UPI001BE759F7|nr:MULTISPECIES: DUF1015 family protein [unclassified Exiguobacterium]